MELFMINQSMNKDGRDVDRSSMDVKKGDGGRAEIERNNVLKEDGKR
jgi:hypothetical protein